VVAHHSCAINEAAERGLADALLYELGPPPDDLADALIHCDMTTGPDGQTHAEEKIVNLKANGTLGAMRSDTIKVTGVEFGRNPAKYVNDWHNAPRRQYIINLDAGVQITASDGESRKIGAGEVILVEDTTGKGHLSKALDGRLRHCIFVTLDDK